MARGGALCTSRSCWSLPCLVQAFQLVACPCRLKANQCSSLSSRCARFPAFPLPCCFMRCVPRLVLPSHSIVPHVNSKLCPASPSQFSLQLRLAFPFPLRSLPRSSISLIVGAKLCYSVAPPLRSCYARPCLSASSPVLTAQFLCGAVLF